MYRPKSAMLTLTGRDRRLILTRRILRKTRQVIRHIDDYDAGMRIQRQLESQRRLVMQNALPPVRGHKFRQYHRHRRLWVVFTNGVNEGNQRCDQRTIWRLDDDELRPGGLL